MRAPKRPQKSETESSVPTLPTEPSDALPERGPLGRVAVLVAVGVEDGVEGVVGVLLGLLVGLLLNVGDVVLEELPPQPASRPPSERQTTVVSRAEVGREVIGGQLPEETSGHSVPR